MLTADNKSSVYHKSLSSVIVCSFANQKLGISVYPFSFVSDSNTFLAVSTGVTTFMFFKNMKIGHSNIINTISATTFGVLLIHANSDSMRKWLWQDFLDNTGMYNSEMLIIHAVGSVLIIFIICSLIDILCKTIRTRLNCIGQIYPKMTAIT